MIVHRLMVWFSRTIARVAGSWNGPSQPDPAHAPARPLAVVGATTHGSGLASSQWLADARRLRARPTPRPTPAVPAAEHLRQILRDPRWAAAFDASRAPRPPRAPQLADPRAGQQSSGPAPSRPLASPGSVADAGTAAELARRRLIFVRELVRRGIYNEGFDPRRLPDQYRPRPSSPDSPPPGSPPR